MRGPEEASYTIHVYGQPRTDGTWVGWLTFVETRTGRTPRTARETTQPNRVALVSWATGLEPVYLEGALDRVRPDGG